MAKIWFLQIDTWSLVVIWPCLHDRLIRHLRLTCRWALLLLLGVVRCVATFTEQPGGSVMRHFPYIDHVRRVVADIIGGSWETTFLSETQCIHHKIVDDRRNGLTCSSTSRYAQLSYMGSFGHKALKPSRSFGTAPWAYYIDSGLFFVI